MVGGVSIRQVIAFVGRGSAPPAPAPPHSPKPDGSSLRIGCFEIRTECVETRNIDGSSFELSAVLRVSGIMYLFMMVRLAVVTENPAVVRSKFAPFYTRAIWFELRTIQRFDIRSEWFEFRRIRTMFEIGSGWF